MKFIMTFRSKSLLITTALILGLSIQTPAAAGNHRTNKSYETYHSDSEITENIIKRNGRQHDVSMAISPDTVQYKLKQKQKITLIDVRNPEDFTRLHIPGSINIPLHAVKTKFVLKSFLIVLINDGFQYSLLATECLKLRDMGFKAFILDGGLYAWNRAESQLTGDLFAAGRHENSYSPEDISGKRFSKYPDDRYIAGSKGNIQESNAFFKSPPGSG